MKYYRSVKTGRAGGCAAACAKASKPQKPKFHNEQPEQHLELGQLKIQARSPSLSLGTQKEHIRSKLTATEFFAEIILF